MKKITVTFALTTLVFLGMGCDKDDKDNDRMPADTSDLEATIQILQERIENVENTVTAQATTITTNNEDVESLLLEIGTLAQQVEALQDDVVAANALAADAVDAVADLEATMPTQLWLYDRNNIKKFKVIGEWDYKSWVRVDIGDGLSTGYPLSITYVGDVRPTVAEMNENYSQDNCLGTKYIENNFSTSHLFTHPRYSDKGFYIPATASGETIDWQSKYNFNTSSCENWPTSTQWMYPSTVTVSMDLSPYILVGPLHVGP